MNSSLYDSALTLWLMAGLRSDKTHSLYFKDVCNIVEHIAMDTPAQYRLIRQLNSLEEYRVPLKNLEDAKTIIHFDAGFSVVKGHATQAVVVLADNGERYIHKRVLTLEEAFQESQKYMCCDKKDKMTSHVAEKIAGYAALSIASQLHGCKAILGDNKTVIEQFRAMHHDMMYWHPREHNKEANFWATASYAHE